MEVGGYRLVMVKKGDIFPSVNELTLCHLFHQHKAAFIHCHR